MKYTGHERDLHSLAGAGDDLDYMHARFCSPVTGRFLSVDPVGGNVRNPQSWNRYGYALNNPLKWVDPDGLLPASQQGRNRLERIADSISAFIGGLLRDLLEEDDVTENPEDQADKPDDTAAQLEAEGIDPSVLPSERAAQVKDAFIEAQARVGGAAAVPIVIAAENAVVGRAISILRPGGKLIGAAGSSSRIRIIEGGDTAAQKLFARLARGGHAVTTQGQSRGIRVVELAPGARIAYRPASATRSGHPTIDVRIEGLGIREIKFD